MYSNPLVLVALWCFLLPQDGKGQDVAANATRPSASDNAYLTAPGHAELEIGWTKDKNLWTVPALLKLSVHEKIEFGFAMSGIVDRPDGGKTEVGTPGAQVKVNIIDHPWGAIAAVTRIDWPSHSSPVYTAYPVASLHTSPLQIDVTLGGVFGNPTGNGYEGSFVYATALSPKLTGNVGTYGEVFGTIGPGVSAHSVDFGVSYSVTPRFVIDASVGFGLTDDAQDWTVQIGFTTTLFRVFRKE